MAIRLFSCLGDFKKACKADFNQISNLGIKIVLMDYSNSSKLFFEHICQRCDSLQSYFILAS